MRALPLNKPPTTTIWYLTKCHQANIINKYAWVSVCAGVCVSVCFYLLGSCHLQYFCCDRGGGWVLTKFDQGDGWSIQLRSEDIQFGHKSRSLSQAKHQREGRWGGSRRVHLLTGEDCGIILSNKYWFRGNKRTWQKLTASSMALTLLSLIGHSREGPPYPTLLYPLEVPGNRKFMD